MKEEYIWWQRRSSLESVYGGGGGFPVCACRIVDAGSRGGRAGHTPPTAVAHYGLPGAVHTNRVLAPVAVGNDAVVVSGTLGRLAASAHAQQMPVRAEDLQEQSLELLPENHVNNEVYGRVYSNEQVAEFHQLVDGDAVERLDDVIY